MNADEFDPERLTVRTFGAVWRRRGKKAADDWYAEVAEAFRSTPTKARGDLIVLLHGVLKDDPSVKNPTERVAALFAPGGKLATEYGTVTKDAIKRLLARRRG